MTRDVRAEQFLKVFLSPPRASSIIKRYTNYTVLQNRNVSHPGTLAFTCLPSSDPGLERRMSIGEEWRKTEEVCVRKVVLLSPGGNCTNVPCLPFLLYLPAFVPIFTYSWRRETDGKQLVTMKRMFPQRNTTYYLCHDDTTSYRLLLLSHRSDQSPLRDKVSFLSNDQDSSILAFKRRGGSSRN